MIKSVLYLLTLLIKTSSNFECCIDDICSPPQIPPRRNQAHLGYEFVSHGSGCHCRQDLPDSLICTGRTTCKNIPQDVDTPAIHFAFTTTAARIVQKFDLAAFEHLQRLDIENNVNLEKIEELTFINMKSLVNISISYNLNLDHLKPKIFYGATNLREVYLVGNGFRHLLHVTPSLSRKTLPHLYNLVLKENHFFYINATDFRPMANSSLQKLNLAQCGIEFIEADALRYLTRLNVLSIGINNLHEYTITKLMRSMGANKIPLKFLNLFKSGLRKRPTPELMKAIDYAGVECLSLAGNKFEIINKKTFPSMKKLKMLDLRDVFAFDITENALYPLRNLKTLLLGNNKFKDIPLGVRQKQLYFLDVSQNSKNFYSEAYFNIQNFTFENATTLQVLNLSFNTLQTLFKNTFIGLNRLRILSLKSCDIFFIEVGTFKQMTKLIFLDLENNYFLLSEDAGDIFKGLNNLEILLLSRNNISHINNNTFAGLSSLKHLSLDNNHLFNLDPGYFLFLSNLHTIDLSDNMITVWNSRVFEPQEKLKVILLNNNKISNFTSALLKDLGKARDIELQQNRFVCDCKLYRILNSWYGKNQTRTMYETLRSTKGTCFPDDTLVADFILSTRQNHSCSVNLLIFVLPIVTLLIVVGGLVYFWYAYRDHFRYFGFLTKLYLIKVGKIIPTKSSSYTNYVYDAFVSYSNDNSTFVTGMIAMLENHEPFFKLCVYERDFQAGTVLTESIIDNVSKSRKIVLVISESFIKSTWCLWETQIAQNYNLFFRNDPNTEDALIDDSLILIKFGTVNKKKLTPTLKYLLKTRIYLQWEEDEQKQEIFWNKLRENLTRGRSEIPVYDYASL